MRIAKKGINPKNVVPTPSASGGIDELASMKFGSSGMVEPAKGFWGNVCPKQGN